MEFVDNPDVDFSVRRVVDFIIGMNQPLNGQFMQPTRGNGVKVTAGNFYWPERVCICGIRQGRLVVGICFDFVTVRRSPGQASSTRLLFFRRDRRLDIPDNTLLQRSGTASCPALMVRRCNDYRDLSGFYWRLVNVVLDRQTTRRSVPAAASRRLHGGGFPEIN